MQNKCYFDPLEWHTQVYKDSNAIKESFCTFELSNKTIKSIYLLGIVDNDFTYRATSIQINAHMPKRYRHKYLNETLIPCNINVNGIIVIIFDDNTSFEFQPLSNKSIKMSVNRLDKKRISCLDCNVLNISKLFRKVLGKTIESLDILQFIENSSDISFNNPYNYCFDLYRFKTGLYSDESIEFVVRGGAWYQIELGKRNIFSFDDNSLIRLPYKDFAEIFNHYRQIPIIEGHDGGACCWFMPVKKHSGNNTIVYEYTDEEISIYEDDAYEFLSTILIKYFDPKIQLREEFEGNEFEWYLTHNVYTYETIKNMICEIRHISQLFKDDFDNENLLPIKSRFDVSTFDNKYIYEHLSDFDKNEIYRLNTDIIVDFYTRFCNRIEAMMNRCQQFNLISFMGP